MLIPEITLISGQEASHFLVTARLHLTPPPKPSRLSDLTLPCPSVQLANKGNSE